MKKILPILLCLAVAVSCFVACSKTGDKDNTTTTQAVTAKVEITTDDAVIKEHDAIKLMESYTDDELGISKEDRERCSFMVASSGEELDGKYYVKVIAAIKVKNADDDGYTFDTKGEYFISYDGQSILRKNMKNNQLADMKLKEVPTEANNE